MLHNQKHNYYKIEELSIRDFEYRLVHFLKNCTLYKFEDILYIIDNSCNYQFFINISNTYLKNYPLKVIDKNKVLYKFLTEENNSNNIDFNSSYRIKYEKNTMIETVNTLGIFCYETESIPVKLRMDNVKRLLPLSKIRNIELTSYISYGDKDIEEFYRSRKKKNVFLRDHITCNKVIVLD